VFQAKNEGYIRLSQNGTDWTSLPTPKKGSGTFQVQTTVNGGRNANGDFIGQPIGSDKCKIDCSWAALEDDAFHNLLALFDRDQGGSYVWYVEFYDPRYGRRVVREMYVGDRKATPYMADSSGRATMWVDVQCNLVEV